MDAEVNETAELSPKERAHLRHRERKRVTKMVVDNAGVKRVTQALAARRRGSGSGTAPPSG